jgi:hypothetical protein
MIADQRTVTPPQASRATPPPDQWSKVSMAVDAFAILRVHSVLA